MGFRAIEIDALLHAAQLERERHARRSAASLTGDSAYRTPRRDRLKTVFRALSVPGRVSAAQPAPTRSPRTRPDRSDDGG